MGRVCSRCSWDSASRRLRDLRERALGGNPQPPPGEGEAPPDLARRYFSRWAGLIQIRTTDEELQLRWCGEAPDPTVSRVVVTGRDRFELVDDPLRGVRGDLLRDANGSLAWLRIRGRLLQPYADGAPIPELDELLRESSS